jgi:hypothetical protein
MVLVSDVHMMASPYIVSNSDGEVSDDATPSTNQAPITNGYDNV